MTAGESRVIRPVLDVGGFVAEGAGGLPVEVVAGHAGLSAPITNGRVQKLSLALTGFTEQIREGRIQVVGETEIRYVAAMTSDERRRVFEASCAVPVTAFLVTKGLAPPPEMLEAAGRFGVPVLVTPERSSVVIDRVHRFMEERIAPRVRIHGVLLDLFGQGVLLLGDSGVGKSECALDLVHRGHRLVADDVVEILNVESRLVGTGPPELRHFMELRGLGIINIKDLFGVAAVSDRERVELVIKLVRWQGGEEVERLGLDDRHHDILGVQVPYLEMPVASGRNIAILVEVATRNQMLKRRGYHPARSLAARLAPADVAGDGGVD